MKNLHHKYKLSFLKIIEEAKKHTDLSWTLRQGHDEQCKVIAKGKINETTKCDKHQYKNKPKRPVCDFSYVKKINLPKI